MKKQKLVIILIVLMVAGAGAGAYVAAHVAPKSSSDASRQAQEKIAANSHSHSDKLHSGDNSRGDKPSKDSKSKQDAPKQPDKKPEKPQPKPNEQKPNPGSQPKPAPQSPSPEPPKHNPQPNPQTQQPSNPQPPAPNPQPNPTPNPQPQPQPIDQDKKYDVGPPDAVEILELINNARSKENLKPLEMYEPLNQTAQLMANDMKENNYFSHYKPGTTNPYGLLKAMSVCRAPAENLVQTSPPNLHTSRVAFNAWMQSPPHKQSIMSDKYRKTGFGIAGNKIVEHFC